MNDDTNLKQEHFNILRKLKNKPDSSQRELAEELGLEA